jgi:DNA-binding protein HU-beta
MKRRAVVRSEKAKKKARAEARAKKKTKNRPGIGGTYMNKADLIEGLAHKTHSSKGDAEGTIDAIFEGITHALSAGDRAVISGLGTFGTTVREARTGRNPKTGESVEISATRSVKFKPGKKLKELFSSKDTSGDQPSTPE